MGVRDLIAGETRIRILQKNPDQTVRWILRGSAQSAVSPCDVRWLFNVMVFAMFFAFLAIFAVKLRCELRGLCFESALPESEVGNVNSAHPVGDPLR